jgi:hypothetical protein
MKPAFRPAILAALAAFALATACGGAPPPPPAAPIAEATDATAPYPYSVTEIRLGCPLGRTLEYRIEKAGAAPIVERWVFTPLDGDTVKIATTTFDAMGNPVGEPASESAKWTELHEHARFPHAATRISNESLTVPAGTFDVMKYVVTKGDEVNTYWFARTLPGPPVKRETVKGGQTVLTMTMQANRTH